MKPDEFGASRIVARLRKMSDPVNVEGMARFGISANNTLGVPVPEIRRLAKEIGVNHTLALELWETGIHEARLLAGFIDDPESVTDPQMEKWAAEFDSWDICDQVCSNLFDHTEYAVSKAKEWTKREPEFVKRAGFVLMAAIAVHDRKAKDNLFTSFLRIIKREADDERNFVRKALNWALRQIGKRNLALNKAAIATATEIRKKGSKSAKWVASDALRELTGDGVARRLKRAQ